MTQFKNPVFVGLDTPDVDKARSLATQLKAHVGGLKLGLEFFNANGPAGLETMADIGLPIFADLKFHDIPNTVAGAIRSITRVKPAIVNIHTTGGPAMMESARKATDEAGADKPLLIGVTVLTSLDEADMGKVGMRGAPSDQVLRLARLAHDCGLDGVVCSPLEVAMLRAELPNDFTLIVPGIRPTWSVTGDQKRIMTPQQAQQAGADILVIARPIIKADDPAQAARKIAEELQ